MGIASKTKKRGPKFVRLQKAKNLKKRAARSAQEQAVRNTQIENAGGWNQAVLPDFLREMLSGQAATNIGSVYDPIEENLRQQSGDNLSRATRGISATGGQAADMLGGLAEGAYARGQESLAQQAAFGDALTAGLASGEAAGGLEAALAAAGQDLGLSDQAVLASQGMTQALQGVNVADLNEQVAMQRAEGDFASALPGIAALQAGQTNQALGLQSQANLSEALAGLSTERAGAMFNEQNRLQEVGIQRKRDALNAAIAEKEFGLSEKDFDESVRATDLADSRFYAGLEHDTETAEQLQLNEIALLQEQGRIDAETYGAETENAENVAAAEARAEGELATRKEKQSIGKTVAAMASSIARSQFLAGTAAKANVGNVTAWQLTDDPADPTTGNDVVTVGESTSTDPQTTYNQISEMARNYFRAFGVLDISNNRIDQIAKFAMLENSWPQKIVDGLRAEGLSSYEGLSGLVG
tara:strand:- start:15328 stop:16737 length:1410 start_codon:yes stop_codon:yes gene_type:complete